MAQKDYYPHLPEIPRDPDEADEDTIKIVQLVKSNEPLVRQKYYVFEINTVAKLEQIMKGKKPLGQGIFNSGSSLFLK